MPAEPLWLELDDVLAFAKAAVLERGEPFGLRDAGALESALSRARNSWTYAGETDVVSLACLIMEGVAKTHAFVQGNKRAAFLAGVAFLRQNGFELEPEKDDLLYGGAISDMIERRGGIEILDPAIRPRIHAIRG